MQEQLHGALVAFGQAVEVDSHPGLLAAPGQRDAVFELFPLEYVPSVTPSGDAYAPDEYNTQDIF